jgi:hypothetical protein
MRYVLAALACVIAVSAVSAQTTSVLPSAAQRCLTRGELLLGTPTYPQAALEAKASGRVSLEFEFTAPDVGPELLRLNVDVSFPTLVAAFRGIRNANVYFDFDSMGCPFEVLFRPMQPHAPNDVGVVGEVNEERRFFLDWLSRQQLDLPAKQVNALLGQEARVSVPCMLLNLGATSGGGGSQ